MGHLPGRHSKREREREMFHLLLLISPAFGMPNFDLIETREEIINQFDSTPIYTEQTKGFFKNVTKMLYKNVAASLQTAEKNILECLPQSPGIFPSPSPSYITLYTYFIISNIVYVIISSLSSYSYRNSAQQRFNK